MFGINGNWRVRHAVGILVVPLLAAPGFADDDARALARRGIESLPHENFVARTRLTNAAGAARELVVKHKMIGEAHASYLEVAAPDDLRGVRFLFLERVGAAPVQYVKVAAAKRHVLVSETGREQPFLDSTFYIADVVHPELDAYTYAVVGDTEMLGRRCKVVEGLPRKPKTEVYGKQRIVLDVEAGFPLRREFFDREGALFKVWTVEKLEKIDGHWTQMVQHMANVREGLDSRIEVISIDYGVPLDDEMFTPDHLLR